MEDNSSVSDTKYIKLINDSDDIEKQLTKKTNSYDTFHSISIEREEPAEPVIEIALEIKCVICFALDISLDQCFYCKTCSECLICEKCIRATLSRKKGNICPVCREENWCRNNKNEIVIMKKPKAVIKKPIRNNNRCDDSFKVIIFICRGVILGFILYFYGIVQ